MSFANKLKQSATIERASYSLDGGGDADVTWSLIASGVPCRLELIRPGETAGDSGIAFIGKARAYFSPATDLRPRVTNRERDRITIDGVVYRVLTARIDSAGRERVLVADLEAE